MIHMEIQHVLIQQPPSRTLHPDMDRSEKQGAFTQ